MHSRKSVAESLLPCALGLKRAGIRHAYAGIRYALLASFCISCFNIPYMPYSALISVCLGGVKATPCNAYPLPMESGANHGTQCNLGK